MKCNPSPACPQRETNESPVSEAGPDCTANEFGRERNVRGGGTCHHRHNHSDGAEEQHVDPTRCLPLPRGCRVRDGIAEAFGHGPTLLLALCAQWVNALAKKQSIRPARSGGGQRPLGRWVAGGLRPNADRITPMASSIVRHACDLGVSLFCVKRSRGFEAVHTRCFHQEQFGFIDTAAP